MQCHWHLHCSADTPKLRQGKIAPPSLNTKFSHEIIPPPVGQMLMSQAPVGLGQPVVEGLLHGTDSQSNATCAKTTTWACKVSGRQRIVLRRSALDIYHQRAPLASTGRPGALLPQSSSDNVDTPTRPQRGCHPRFMLGCIEPGEGNTGRPFEIEYMRPRNAKAYSLLTALR